MAIGTVAQIVKAVKAIDYQTDYRFDVIESVSFDTRKLTQNSLFIPLKGQLMDMITLNKQSKKAQKLSFGEDKIKLLQKEFVQFGWMIH